MRQMAEGTIQDLIFERLDHIEKEQIQQGKDIAAIKQHLKNNAEHKKLDWSKTMAYIGWLVTLVVFLLTYLKK